MVDKKIRDAINDKLDELEKYAQDRIDPSRGRNTYYDMIDAVGICRRVMSQPDKTGNDLEYLNDTVKALKEARANYRFSAVDEDGYGIVTFHQVIDVALPV